MRQIYDNTVTLLKGLLRMILSRCRSCVLETMQGIRRWGRYYMVRIGSNSGFLGLMYLALFSKSFRRECRGVLLGLSKNVYQPMEKNSYLLRRSIHRLEKGLLMQPRREVFAVDYITETVQCYRYLAGQAKCDRFRDNEVRWAHDVLRRYFQICGDHTVVNSAREVFESIGYHSDDTSVPYVPCKPTISEPSPVDYQAILELAKRRKSVRWYLPKPVRRELIDRAIEVANLAPSACNRQPFEFLVLDDPATVRELASLPMGAHGFAHNIPVLVIVVGKLDAFFNERDRHLIYIDGSLATMPFLLALETLGLNSCCLNWPEIEEKELLMTKRLHLQPDERIVMLIAVGYGDPQGLVASSGRKSLDSIRRYPSL